MYYAHLASNRARHHENVWSSSASQTLDKKKPSVPSSDLKDVEVPQLLPMPTNGGFNLSMWYV